MPAKRKNGPYTPQAIIKRKITRLKKGRRSRRSVPDTLKRIQYFEKLLCSISDTRDVGSQHVDTAGGGSEDTGVTPTALSPPSGSGGEDVRTNVGGGSEDTGVTPTALSPPSDTAGEDVNGNVGGGSEDTGVTPTALSPPSDTAGDVNGNVGGGSEDTGATPTALSPPSDIAGEEDVDANHVGGGSEDTGATPTALSPPTNSDGDVNGNVEGGSEDTGVTPTALSPPSDILGGEDVNGNVGGGSEDTGVPPTALSPPSDIAGDVEAVVDTSLGLDFDVGGHVDLSLGLCFDCGDGVDGDVLGDARNDEVSYIFPIEGVDGRDGFDGGVVGDAEDDVSSYSPIEEDDLATNGVEDDFDDVSMLSTKEPIASRTRRRSSMLPTPPKKRQKQKPTSNSSLAVPGAFSDFGGHESLIAEEPSPTTPGDVLQLKGVLRDRDRLIDIGLKCTIPTTRNLVMVYEMPLDMSKSIPKRLLQSEGGPIMFERWVERIAHIYVVLQDDVQVGWACNLSRIPHYLIDVHSLSTRMQLYFSEHPQSSIGVTCVGLGVEYRDKNIFVVNGKRDDPALHGLPFWVTEKQLQLLTDTAVKATSNIGVKRQQVFKDLGFASNVCQSRGTRKSLCSLGLSAPNLLEGSKSQTAEMVFKQLKKFLRPTHAAGLRPFADLERNKSFAGRLAKGNCVETTRAAAYNYDNRLEVHTDGLNGTQEGYSDVVWASQLSEETPTLRSLLPSQHSNDVYRLSQILYSRLSVEGYQSRLKKFGPFLRQFQDTYAGAPTSQRQFIAETIQDAQPLPIITGWNLGVVPANMAYECHIQPYVNLAETIITKFRLGFIGAVGIAWVLSQDPSCALGHIFATHLLLCLDSHRLDWFEVTSNFYLRYKKVVRVGIGHLFEGETPGRRFEPGDLAQPPGDYDLSRYKTRLMEFASDLHGKKYMDAKFAESPEEYYDNIVSMVRRLPGMKSNPRATDHMVALLSIMGLLPLEFFHMSTIDCSKTETYKYFLRKYGDSVPQAMQWQDHVTSSIKKWLADNGSAESLVKCQRYMVGSIDVVGNLLRESSSSQGILDLDGANYVVVDGVLRCFHGDMSEPIVIGERGIFQSVVGLSDNIEQVQLQSCWETNPKLFSTLNCLKDEVRLMAGVGMATQGVYGVGHSWLAPYTSN